MGFAKMYVKKLVNEYDNLIKKGYSEEVAVTHIYNKVSPKVEKEGLHITKEIVKSMIEANKN